MKHVALIAIQTGARSNGGLESATRICEALRDDYRWSLYTNHHSAFTERWAAAGADVYRMAGPASRLPPLRWLSRQGMRRRLRTELRRSRPDIVHLNDIHAYNALGPAFGGDHSLIFTLRDSRPETEAYAAKWTDLANECDRIIVLSKEMGTTLARRVPATRGKICPIGSVVTLPPPDPAGRARARGQLGVPDGQICLLSIGVFREKKNQLFLIEDVLPELIRRQPRAHVHFLGDFDPGQNAYARHCQDAVMRLGISEHLTFHGYAEDMSLWYQACDLVVSGSRYEGLPRFMIEGMGYGVPVVTTDVCSAREMLEGHHAGIVVPQNAGTQFATEAADLLEDGHRMQTMRENGRRAAQERFAADVIAADYRKLYDEA